MGVEGDIMMKKRVYKIVFFIYMVVGFIWLGIAGFFGYIIKGLSRSDPKFLFFLFGLFFCLTMSVHYFNGSWIASNSYKIEGIREWIKKQKLRYQR